MPGNPENKDFPSDIELIKCIDCNEDMAIILNSDIQGRCRKCHEKWMENFIEGRD